MCVNTTSQNWERPAVNEDCAILARFFPGVDFEGLLQAMSTDGAKPLTSDLVLVGAVLNMPADDLGVKSVPFSALNLETREVVKLPIMDQIVEWFENTGLGTDMWHNASDWCEREKGVRVHFTMNCRCPAVPRAAIEDGRWTAWKRRDNARHADIFGRSRVVRRDTDSLENLDMTAAALMMWRRIRMCLEALPAVQETTVAKAA